MIGAGVPERPGNWIRNIIVDTSVDLSIKWTGSNSGIDNDSGIEVAELDQHSTDQVTGSSDMIK